MQVRAIERTLKSFMENTNWTADDECSEVALDLKKRLKAGIIVTFIRPKSDRFLHPFATEVHGRPSTEMLDEGLFDYHTVVCVTHNGIKYIVDPFKAKQIVPINEYVNDLRLINNTNQKFVCLKGEFDNYIVDWMLKLKKNKVKHIVL